MKLGLVGQAVDAYPRQALILSGQLEQLFARARQELAADAAVSAGYGYGQYPAVAVPQGMYIDQMSGLLLPEGTELASVGRRIGLSLNEGGELRSDRRHALKPGEVYSLAVGACDPQAGGALTSAMVAITPTGSELLHVSPASKLQ